MLTACDKKDGNKTVVPRSLSVKTQNIERHFQSTHDDAKLKESKAGFQSDAQRLIIYFVPPS